jgi:hypothetical protein
VPTVTYSKDFANASWYSVFTTGKCSTAMLQPTRHTTGTATLLYCRPICVKAAMTAK